MWIIFLCPDIPQFIYSLPKIHFGCLQIWTIINKAVAMNVCVQDFTFSSVLCQYRAGWLPECSKFCIAHFSYAKYIFLSSNIMNLCRMMPMNAPQFFTNHILFYIHDFSKCILKSQYHYIQTLWESICLAWSVKYTHLPFILHSTSFKALFLVLLFCPEKNIT